MTVDPRLTTSICYFCDAADGGLCGQSEFSSSDSVVGLMQVELTEGVDSEPSGGNRRAGIVATFQRRPQNGGLFARRQELDGSNEFHTSYMEDYVMLRRNLR
jgi:hypothetical protein